MITDEETMQPVNYNYRAQSHCRANCEAIISIRYKDTERIHCIENDIMMTTMIYPTAESGDFMLDTKANAA